MTIFAEPAKDVLDVDDGVVDHFTERGAGADPSKGCAYDAAADARSWAAMRTFFAELFAKKP